MAETMKIRWLGKGEKKVELPIPYVSKSEKTGEVLCNPIGEFPIEDGKRLLEIPGIEGSFELVGVMGQKAPETAKAVGPEYYDKTCECGCGERLQKKASHKNTGIPRFILGHSMRKMKEKTAPSPSQIAAE